MNKYIPHLVEVPIGWDDESGKPIGGHPPMPIMAIKDSGPSACRWHDWLVFKAMPKRGRKDKA